MAVSCQAAVRAAQPVRAAAISHLVRILGGHRRVSCNQSELLVSIHVRMQEHVINEELYDQASTEDSSWEIDTVDGKRAVVVHLIKKPGGTWSYLLKSEASRASSSLTRPAQDSSIHCTENSGKSHGACLRAGLAAGHLLLPQSVLRRHHWRRGGRAHRFRRVVLNTARPSLTSALCTSGVPNADATPRTRPMLTRTYLAISIPARLVRQCRAEDGRQLPSPLHGCVFSAGSFPCVNGARFPLTPQPRGFACSLLV